MADLADAVTPYQAHVAFDQLEGALTRAIGALDRELFDLVARTRSVGGFPRRGLSLRRPGKPARRFAVCATASTTSWPRAPPGA